MCVKAGFYCVQIKTIGSEQGTLKYCYFKVFEAEYEHAICHKCVCNAYLPNISI